MGVCCSQTDLPHGELCCVDTDGAFHEGSPVFSERVQNDAWSDSPASPAGVERFSSSMLIQSEAPRLSDLVVGVAPEVGKDWRPRSETSVHSAAPRKVFTTASSSTSSGPSSSRAARIMQELLGNPPSEGSDAELSEAQVDRIVGELEFVVDWQYDTMLAELMLLSLKDQYPLNECSKVYRRAVMGRLIRKFVFFDCVGEACCSKDASWFNMYRDGAKASIDGCLDKSDANVLHYKARIAIPAPLSTVMAIAHEVDLMPQWNKLVTAPPEVLGRRTAHYMCLNYHLSIMGGMYKVDILNEIRRFSDIEGGVLVEYICSIEGGHPCYREPLKGFKRPQTELKNVWIACGADSTVMVQIGKLKLPFSASKWLATSVGGVAGRFIVGGLLNNSLKASQPGSPWEKRLEEDNLGLFQRLREISAGKGSLERAVVGNGSSPSFKEEDLAPLFENRRKARASFASWEEKAEPPAMPS